MTNLLHPIEDALGQFDLIAGAGSETEKRACAMTLLAWVCGEDWSDHPPCAHRLIANIVIRANDADSTTPDMRRELVKLGVDGALDTWWIPDEVVLWSLAGEDQAPFPAALRMLENVAAWKRSKERPVLSGAVLRDADLSGAVLRGAVLSGAILSGAGLRGAILSGAVLRDADLSGAILSGAVLSGAVLRGAILSGADLSDADLSRAILSGAVLRDADLRGAYYAPLSGMPSGWKLSESSRWEEA